MWQIFQRGGPLMYPILFCSVLALAIFFERLYTFFQVNRGTENLVREVETLVVKEHIDEAVIVCQRAATPLARVLIAALRQAGKPREQIKAIVDEVGSREAAPLERYLGLMGTIATLSPLLGLLGTVVGMIQCFNVIAAAGVGTPATLGGGISVALLTTVAGLSVAIPVILLHKYLSSRVDRIVLEMETFALHIVDLLGR